MSNMQPAPLLTLFLLLACGRTQPPDASDEQSPRRNGAVVDGLTYSAETRVLETFPVTLQTEATVTNEGSERRAVTFPDGCVVLLRAYRDPARSGSPAWDQSRSAICTMMIMNVPFEPGESKRYRTTATAADILGDSLPPGRYYFTAFLRPDGQTIEVPAGEADLAR